MDNLLLTDEEIKEVIYMAIEIPDKDNDEGWKNKQRFQAVAKAQLSKVLNLLSEELEKMTVITEAELRDETGLMFGKKAKEEIDKVLQAQLNHDKEHWNSL